MPFSKGHIPQNYAKVQVNCSNCGKPKSVSPSVIKRNSHFFCNLDCRDIFRTDKPRELSEKVRSKLSSKMRAWNLEHSGNKASNWKGGITPLYRLIRSSVKYQEWQRVVKERDNFTCQRCFKRGGRLASHHIKPIKDFPELAYEIENGITYCTNCHKQIEKELKRNRVWKKLS